MTDLDLRERLAVEDDDMRATVDPAPLRAWAVMPRRLPGAGVEALVRALPLLVLAMLIWLSQGGPWVPVLVAQAMVGLVALARRPQVREVIDAVDSASRDLDVFLGVARLMEKRTDMSARLRQLREALAGPGGPASSSIATLAQFVALLSSRSNVIFAPLAALLMWATQCAFLIERWRGRHGHNVPAWLDAVAEFDALCALAGFAAEHPGYVFPVLTAGPSHLEALLSRTR